MARTISAMRGSVGLNICGHFLFSAPCLLPYGYFTVLSPFNEKSSASLMMTCQALPIFSGNYQQLGLDGLSGQLFPAIFTQLHSIWLCYGHAEHD